MQNRSPHPPSVAVVGAGKRRRHLRFRMLSREKAASAWHEDCVSDDMEPRPWPWRPEPEPPDDAAFLDTICFWRAVYPLRGADDSIGVVGVEEAVFQAEHRFETLRVQDMYLRHPFISR